MNVLDNMGYIIDRIRDNKLHETRYGVMKTLDIITKKDLEEIEAKQINTELYRYNKMCVYRKKRVSFLQNICNHFVTILIL